MAKQLFSNNASATLSGTLSAGGSALTLATGDGAKFPVPTGGDWFEITVYKKDISGTWLDIETMKISARVGDTLTIATRDYDGNIGDTAGIAHDGVADVVYVEMLWTSESAESLQDYTDDVLADHIGDSDPHTQYLTEAAASAGYQPLATNLTTLAGATITAAGLALLDDASASAQRTTLGLGSVDNTADSAKPVSSAQQTALDLKTNRRFTLKTGAYTAVPGDRIACDTSAASWTLTLPASPTNGDTVELCDTAGSFSTHALTIGRNALKIMGLSEDMTVSTDNMSFGLVYTGSTYGWRIF